MRRFRVARWILTAVAIVVCLLASAAVAIQTTWFHDWLRRQALTRAAQWFDGELTIGSLTGDVVRGMTLHDVTVRRNGTTVISLSSVAVNYRVIGLLRGRTAFSDIILVRPSLTVSRTATGWSVDGVRTTPAGGATAVSLDRITIDDGTIDVRGDVNRHVTHVTAHGSFSSADSRVDVSIQDLSARDETAGVDIDQLAATAAVTPHAIDVKSFVLKTPGSAVTGHGSFDRDRHVVDLATTASPLALAEASRYVPALGDRTLNPAFDVQARGPLGQLQIQVNARSSAGAMSASLVADLESAITTASGIADVRELNLSPILDRADLAGRLTGHGSFRVTSAGADTSLTSIAFDATLPEAAVGRYRATAVHATGTYAGGTLKGAVRGDAYGAHADLRGSWSGFARTEVARYSVSGQMSGVRLPEIGRVLDVGALRDERLAGIVNGTFEVQGQGRSLDHQQARAFVTLASTTLGGVRVPQARIAATLADRHLKADVQGMFSNFDAHTLGLTSASDTVAAGAIIATVTVPDIRARLDVRALTGDISLTLTSSQLAGFVVDRGQIDAALADGTATVRQFDLAGPTGAVHVDGTLALGDQSASNLRYTVDVADLSPIGAATGHAMTGRAHADGTIAGPRERVAVTGTVSGQQLTFGDSAVALTANSEISATLPEWQLTRATGTAESHATFVTIHGSDFQRIGVTATYDSDGLTFKGEIDRPTQHLTIDGAAVAHPDAHDVDVHRLTVSDTRSTWQLAEPMMTIAYSRDRVSVSPATFVNRSSRIGVSGSIALDAGASDASALDVTFDALQLADVAALVLDRRDLAGQLDGTLRVTGAVTNPAVQSHAVVTGGSVNGVAFERLAADLTYRQKRIGVNVTLQQAGAERLTAVGSLPTDRHEGSIDLQVRTDAIDARLFQPLTSNVQFASGAVQADAHVSGSLDAPSVKGTLETNDVGFAVVATGMRYQHLNGLVRFDADAARIEHLSVEDDDRHVLTGQGGVQGWFGGSQNIGFQLSANAFHLLRNDLGELGVDVAVQVSGSLEHPALSGTLKAHTARLNFDALRERFGIALDEPVDAAAPPAPKGLFARSAWSLAIDLPNNMIVQGQPSAPALSAVSLGGINATIGGTLTFAKPADGDSAVTGRLQVVRGTYQFQGRSFQIANGSEIRFQGRKPIDPDLAITAERDVQGVTVNVNVTGSMRRPRVALSSNPPLDQGDVLALILFNQPINELGQSDRSVLTDRAAAMATGALTAPLASAVADALSLDLFEITPAGDSGAGPTVALGRQIGGNLFVRVQQALSDSQDSQLQIEYQFSKFLRLVTSFAQGTQSSTLTHRAERGGIDLVFVIRFSS